jgi:hypothetical protein
MFWWMLIAALIVVALASYAGYLLFLLRQKNQQLKLKAAQVLQENTQSLEIISRAMLEHQCELAEGVIRMVHLVRQRDDALVLQSRLSELFAFQEKIQHQPIGKARKHLSKQERMRFDVERMRLESTHQEAILEELKHFQKNLAAIKS